MHRGRVRPVGAGVDGHLVRHHEGGVEAQAEMADDLVLVGLVFIFVQEILGAGKGDLVDVLLHLALGHAKSVVLHHDGAVLLVHRHRDLVVRIVRLLILAHEGQLL